MCDQSYYKCWLLIGVDVGGIVYLVCGEHGAEMIKSSGHDRNTSPPLPPTKIRTEWVLMSMRVEAIALLCGFDILQVAGCGWYNVWCDGSWYVLIGGGV